MEAGQASGTKAGSDRASGTWARLVPDDCRYAEIDIQGEEAEICSETTCFSSEKQIWCLIIRNPDGKTAKIQNTSSGALLVDGKIIGKEEAVDILCGSKIVPTFHNRGCLHYTFDLPEENKHEEKSIMVSIDAENSKCSICLNIWHDVVTVAPCLHNFCNGCFSEWLKQSQKKHQTVLCPQCRAAVLSVGRNHFLHNIEEAILQKFPMLKRSGDDLALLDKCASIQSNLVLGMKKISSRKRALPTDDETDDDSNMHLQCPQCVIPLGGFRCNQNTVHLQCHACTGMMPSRDDVGVPQICLGCDRVFCGAYWQSQGVNFGDVDRMCTRETFRPIAERIIFRIPESAHQNNRHEQSITEKCIQQSGKTLQVVIADWIIKFNDRDIDRSRMPLKHAETLSSQTHLCNECYHKFIGYLLYWFRISLPYSLLPPNAANREDCWYGYACRTQHHNDDHAQRRNHVCPPTRGNLDAHLLS